MTIWLVEKTWVELFFPKLKRWWSLYMQSCMPCWYLIWSLLGMVATYFRELSKEIQRMPNSCMKSFVIWLDILADGPRYVINTHCHYDHMSMTGGSILFALPYRGEGLKTGGGDCSWFESCSFWCREIGSPGHCWISCFYVHCRWLQHKPLFHSK